MNNGAESQLEGRRAARRRVHSSAELVDVRHFVRIDECYVRGDLSSHNRIPSPAELFDIEGHVIEEDRRVRLGQRLATHGRAGVQPTVPYRAATATATIWTHRQIADGRESRA